MAFFHLYFYIYSQIWGRTNSIVKRLQVLQNKALRIINFESFRSSATRCFKESEILKVADHVSLQNILFAHDSINENLPSSLCGAMNMVGTIYNTRNEMYHQLNTPCTRTVTYGSKSIRSKSVEIWNLVNRSNPAEKLKEKSRAACKIFVKKFLLSQY